MICRKMGIRQLLIDSFYPESFEVNIQRVQIDFMDYEKLDKASKNFCADSKAEILFISVLCLVIPFCLWAGYFEFYRAQEGHWRA